MSEPAVATDRRKLRRGPRLPPKDKHAVYRHHLMEAGRCPRCGAEPEEDYVLCNACRAKHNRLNRLCYHKRDTPKAASRYPKELRNKVEELCGLLHKFGDMPMLDEDFIFIVAVAALRHRGMTLEEIEVIVQWAGRVVYEVAILGNLLDGALEARVEDGELMLSLAHDKKNQVDTREEIG